MKKDDACVWCIAWKGSVSIQIRENTDQKNSKYGHFSRSDGFDDQLELSKVMFFPEVYYKK